MMTNKTSILLLAFLALPVAAHAQTGANPQDQAGSYGPGACPGWGMGPGMMGPGMGMMGDDWGGMDPGMMGPGMMMGHGLNSLNLTDKQRAQISEIQGKLIKPQWDLAAKMNDERLKLQQAYSAEKVDPLKVREIYANIGQLRQQMAELRAKAHNEMMDVLTKEQREQLSNMRRGMWGQGMGGAGMGPGMMHRRPSPAGGSPSPK